MLNADRPKPQFRRPGNESLYPSKTDTSQIYSATVDRSLPSDAESQPTFIYNRHHHLPLENQRQNLPIFQYRNHILYLLESYQCLILVGDTGCGKSTQVPQYLYEIGHNVCVTEPRVSAAVTLATRVSHERGTECGQLVGYAVSMDATRSKDTRILYVTEGSLIREMYADPLLTQYTALVLDEVHERSLNTDVLMALVKKIMKKRKNLKVVVSSATMDAEHLKDYFNLKPRETRDKESTSVVMSVQGRQHAVDIHYVNDPVPDYVKSTVETIIKIHENEPFGDILAFLTSQEEIMNAVQMLNEYSLVNEENNRLRTHYQSGMRASRLTAVPMYGGLPHYKQLEAFKMAPSNVRKVVVATNICETSVTLNGVVYVVDCGFHKMAYFDPTLSIECLSVCCITRANAIQRAGRAGRTAKGKCYRLYTEEEYNKMSPSVPPEIMRSDLSSTLLQLKALGIDNLLRFNFCTSPPAKLVLAALECLYALNALDNAGNLTELGNKMSELPLRPIYSRALCMSGEFGCLEEMLTIVSLLQIDNIFVKPVSGKDSLAAKHSRRNNFAVEEGDLITYLNVFQSYQRVKKTGGDNEKRSAQLARDWCRKMYINEMGLTKAMEIRNGLSKLLRKFNVSNNTDVDGTAVTRIQRCLTASMFMRVCRLTSQGYRCRAGTGAVLQIAQDSDLYGTEQSEWLLYCEVQNVGGRSYMRHITRTEKSWLLEYASHYYHES